MSRRQIWIIAAAGLVFALIFGVRQSVALFIGPINSATGLGVAAISLAFACAQLMWGITQPIAGAVADKYGTGRVVAAGAVLVMLGTVLTPHATSAWMLVLFFGIVMFSHQVGGFLGAWLGGYVFERTGSYDWLWYIDIMLAFGAALIHMPIKEAPKLRPAFAT